MALTHLSPISPDRPVATVLIVEDDPILRFSLAMEVSEAGFCVREAASADEAETVLESGVTIHVVVTDVEMPGSRDGLALAKTVRAFHPHMKVIVASGVVPPADIVGIADAFFGKPYDTDRVIFRIRSLLGAPHEKQAEHR
ncbi:response regulator [Hyphomicrobium sp.]|uniref:response regulator n=1 Tax=Hyphomicrobium sp. TaxID=82 RepID=UPI002E35BB19|nr:response regulator [Hyphomicrobium sp.]HEX2840407.1 response regulator [Hyphomicrobium sp.]